MSGAKSPDPFAGDSPWTDATPRPIVPTPAMMTGSLRGRRVLIGLPGHGWRGDLRADEKVVQGSRTYVPVMPEAGILPPRADVVARLVSLDEPPRREPVAATDADHLVGRRLVQMLEDGGERRELRSVTELHSSDNGDICGRVASELDWYRWAWSGRVPPTLEVPAHLLWVE